MWLIIMHTIQKKLAGAEGFEPPIIGPKPIALPLGHAPKLECEIFYLLLFIRKMRTTLIHDRLVFLDNAFFNHATRFGVQGMHNVTKCSIFAFT